MRILELLSHKRYVHFTYLKVSPAGKGGSISLPAPDSILYAKNSDPVIREGSHP